MEDAPVIIRNRLKKRRRHDSLDLGIKGGEILRFIRSKPNGCALAREIAEVLRIPENLVSRIARLLVNAGLIRRHWVKPSGSNRRRMLYCIYDSPYYPQDAAKAR